MPDTGAGARLLPGEFGREAVNAGARALLVDDAAREAARRPAIEIATMLSPAEVVDRSPEQSLSAAARAAARAAVDAALTALTAGPSGLPPDR